MPVTPLRFFDALISLATLFVAVGARRLREDTDGSVFIFTIRTIVLAVTLEGDVQTTTVFLTKYLVQVTDLHLCQTKDKVGETTVKLETAFKKKLSNRCPSQ